MRRAASPCPGRARPATRSHRALCNAPGSAVALAIVAVLGAGCSKTIVPTAKIDYKSASKEQAAPLEVPPDLTAPAANDRYAVPGAGRSTATYSEYRQDRPAAAQGAQSVL